MAFTSQGQHIGSQEPYSENINTNNVNTIIKSKSENHTTINNQQSNNNISHNNHNAKYNQTAEDKDNNQIRDRRSNLTPGGSIGINSNRKLLGKLEKITLINENEYNTQEEQPNSEEPNSTIHPNAHNDYNNYVNNHNNYNTNGEIIGNLFLFIIYT